jgi:hypothetical protein
LVQLLPVQQLQQFEEVFGGEDCQQEPPRLRPTDLVERFYLLPGLSHPCFVQLPISKQNL